MTDYLTNYREKRTKGNVRIISCPGKRDSHVARKPVSLWHDVGAI